MVIYKKRKKSEVTGGKKFENFQTYGGFKKRSILFPMLYNMVKDEIIKRVTERLETAVPENMVYTSNIVIWETNTLEKKFQGIVRVYKDCG